MKNRFIEKLFVLGLGLSALPSLAFDGKAYVTPKIGYGVGLVDNAYLELGGSKISLPDENENMFLGGFSLGYDMGAIRSEAELLYSQIDVTYSMDSDGYFASDEYNVSILTGFMNIYYDIHTNTALTPYIGGGMGLSSVNMEYTSKLNGQTFYNKEQRNNNFAWHIGVGASYEISDNMSLDLSYRYMDLGKYKIEDNNLSLGLDYTSTASLSGNLSSHQALLGFRISF